MDMWNKRQQSHQGQGGGGIGDALLGGAWTTREAT